MSKGKMKVWNTTLASRPRTVTLYGKAIQPGQHRLIDAEWVNSYPHVLQSAIASRQVHLGNSLPSWYLQALKEKKMKRITNESTKSVILSAPNLSSTKLKPGESCEAADEVVDVLVEGCNEKDGLAVEKVKEETPEKQEPVKAQEKEFEKPVDTDPVKEKAEEGEVEEDEKSKATSKKTSTKKKSTKTK